MITVVTIMIITTVQGLESVKYPTKKARERTVYFDSTVHEL